MTDGLPPERMREAERWYIVRCGHCERLAEASMGECPFCGYDGIDPASEGIEVVRAAAVPVGMNEAVQAFSDAVHIYVPPKAVQGGLEAALPFLGGLPPEPSGEACKASFEHWFCATGEKGWDAEDESVREDWREGMRKAYAADARSLDLTDEEIAHWVMELRGSSFTRCEWCQGMLTKLRAELARRQGTGQ